MIQTIIRIGKKGAIYLPKKVMSDMGIKEGDSAILKIEENRVVIEIIPDPLTLALKTKKWTNITVEEFERESESMQEELYEA